MMDHGRESFGAQAMMPPLQHDGKIDHGGESVGAEIIMLLMGGTIISLSQPMH